jgi:hypothetical protein
MQGRVVASRSYNVQQGANSLPVDLSGVSAGTYLLRWNAGATQGVIKMEKR